MNDILSQDWNNICASFELECELGKVLPVGSGHINDTFIFNERGQTWVLQHINSQVFPNPQLVQQNFEKISEHLRKSDYPLAILKSRKTRNGHSLALAHGRSWRIMEYIPNCSTYDTAQRASEAYSAAAAVGHFNRALKKLSIDEIKPTIEGFHNLQLRLVQFNQSLLKNHENRVAKCADELEVVKQFARLADWIPKAKANHLIQQHVVHNDTKISNILICKRTGTARAVIDWDTVMPGYYLYDYGDMVRSFVPGGGEDNPKECYLRWEILQALTEGYLSSCGETLRPFERENLLVGAEIIIFMIGVRFLTDYFNGDIYFKTSREEQNLDRAKTQFELLKQLHSNHQDWQRRLGLAVKSKSA